MRGLAGSEGVRLAARDEDAGRQAIESDDGAGFCLFGIADLGESAVAGTVDGAELLFGHILNADGQRGAEAGDVEGAWRASVAEALVVIRVDNLKCSMVRNGGILDGNHDAVD